MIGQHVIKLIRLFEEDHTDIHNEKMSGKPSVASEKLVQQVEEKIYNDRRLTCDILKENFLHILRRHLSEAVTEKLGYRELRTRRAPKMLISEHRQNRVFEFCEFLKPYKWKDETISTRL